LRPCSGFSDVSALFEEPPYFAPNGTFWFKPAGNQYGRVSVQVYLQVSVGALA
jgi:hypothetical protein